MKGFIILVVCLISYSSLAQDMPIKPIKPRALLVTSTTNTPTGLSVITKPEVKIPSIKPTTVKPKPDITSVKKVVGDLKKMVASQWKKVAIITAGAGIITYLYMNFNELEEEEVTPKSEYNLDRSVSSEIEKSSSNTSVKEKSDSTLRR